VIHANLHKILGACGIVDAMTEETLNGQAKGAALSRFEVLSSAFSRNC
jgi:hypothetical protein